ARDHLKGRGIAVETAKTWRLGYAPELWDSLCKSLARGKVDAKLVEGAGLGGPRKKQQGLYDRFRGRGITPIRDAGRTVAFGARELVFVFDGDAAGLRAAQRASEIAAAAAVPARVLVPPGGEDPDETVLRVGLKGFRELIASAQPALEFLLDRALEKTGGPGAPIEERVRVVEAVAGIVRAAPTALARDLYVEKVAQRIDAPVDAVRLALEGKRPTKKPAPPAREQTSGRQVPKDDLALVREELAILA